MDYYKALLDPFDYASNDLPCIPDLYDVPSFKLATRQRGLAVIGTQNFGFISVAPYAYGSDQFNVLSSTSSFALSTFPPSIANSASYLLSQNDRYPYSAAAAPPTRVVACGLRIRYTGTELNRGGVVAPVLANQISDNLAVESFTQTLSRPTVQTQSIERKWIGCVLKPLRASDYEYTQDGGGGRGLLSGSTIASTNQLMGIAITGLPGNTFEWELVTYFEMVPGVTQSGATTTVPTTTKSHSDVSGISMIRDYVGGLFDNEIGKAAIATGLKYFQSHYFGAGTPSIEYL